MSIHTYTPLTLIILTADACVNADCDGCCSRDSIATGYLLVMEYYTVMRHFGSDKAVNGLITFRVFDE